MGKIDYAYVIYTDDKQFSTVSISDVKLKKDSQDHITPTSDSDFDKRKYYYVKWSDCDKHCQEDHLHFGYYPAFVLLLGESRADINRKIVKGRRLSIPCNVPSSESEENIKPLENAKKPTLMQQAQKKKNIDILNKHKAEILLASRRPLTADFEDHNENPKQQEEIDDQEKEDARQEEESDELDEGLHNNGDDAGYSAPGKYRSNTKPSITSSDKVTLTSDRVRKSSAEPDNQNPLEERGNLTWYESEQTKEDHSNSGNAGNKNRKRKSEQMSQTQSTSRRTDFRPEEDRRERSSSEDPDNPPVINLRRREIASAPLENRVDGEIESGDSDGIHENERVIERLQVRDKMRRRKPAGVGRKGKTCRDIDAALQYYENLGVDQNGRKMYDLVEDKKIYLEEGVEASATLWFMFKQNKPTIFFNNMLGLLWPEHKLLNRCLNKDKVSTKLLDRFPVKELTPEKKRLSYKLFSDYLDSKKVALLEQMKFLLKVPAMYSYKIRNLG